MQFSVKELESVFNPIKYRKSSVELKGGWQFSFDGGSWRDINVPFAPQSILSGIGYTDFIYECYYKKAFEADKSRGRVILNFGAVDYAAEVFVNGSFIGSHRGGYTPFAFDITDKVSEGNNELFIKVTDNETNIPFGKQSYKKNSFGCFYTRTTGIWQPVWIEYTPEKYISSFKFYPCVADCSVAVELKTLGEGEYSVGVFYKGNPVGTSSGKTEGKTKFTISLSEKHPWSALNGELYDVVLNFEGDEVHSYFGLRELEYRGYDFFINGERVYQKLVLDQGFYPDGVYTPASVDKMEEDIDFAIALGFNGVRLHQKVFDPRHLYLCDKRGLLCWGEFPSWGINYANTDSLDSFLSEWGAVIERDFNHPSIIHWCPLNEVWGASWDAPPSKRDVRYVDGVYEFTKEKDNTRPVVDVSGGHHGHKTDLYDFHCYDTPDIMKGYLDKFENEGVLSHPLLYVESEDLRYEAGIPVNLSEFGGIAFAKNAKMSRGEGNFEGDAILNEEAWGYGEGESDEAGFIERYRNLVELIYRYDKISGFCYTQLYDIEQETNGFRTYSREDKLTDGGIAEIKRINELK